MSLSNLFRSPRESLRKVFRMFSIAFLLLCLTASRQWSTLAEPLSKVNDYGFPANHAFHSADYADTDVVCLDLYKSWIEEQTEQGIGLRYSQKRPLPLVVSSNIQLLGFSMTFLCRDQRTQNAIANAIKFENEVAVTGPFHLLCKPEVEVARRRPRPPGLKHDPAVRAPGECVPRASGNSESVLVAAGTSNCVDLRSQDYASIEAYLMDEDAGTSAENVSREEYANWMSILEIGTSRHEQVKFQNFVSMTTDSGQSKVYRACAKMQSGHGNARLYVAAV